MMIPRNHDESQLDKALRNYGRSEPRAGLEHRVLAHLAAEREHPVAQGWRWQFTLATAVVMLAVAALFIARSIDSPSITPGNQRSIAKGVSTPAPVISTQRATLAPKQLVRKSRPSAAAVRLAQFPSPAPLNAQEQLLARYVRERHAEAIMAARAQAEVADREFLADTEQLPSVVKLPDSQQ